MVFDLQDQRCVWGDMDLQRRVAEQQRNVSEDPEHLIQQALAQRFFPVFTPAQKAAFELWRLECSIQDRFDRCCHR